MFCAIIYSDISLERLIKGGCYMPRKNRRHHNKPKFWKYTRTLDGSRVEDNVRYNTYLVSSKSPKHCNASFLPTQKN